MVFVGFCLSTSFIRPVKSNSMKLNPRTFLLGALSAGILTPLLLNFYSLSISSFPAHNYLLNHLAVFSIILSFIFPRHTLNFAMRNFNLGICVILFSFYTLIFGSVLDSYVSSFYPTGLRIPLFFLLTLGCVPLTVIMQLLHSANKKAWLQSTLAKSIFILSLMIAIALNFKELFLLAYAVLLLIGFFFVFGFLSNFLARTHGSSLSIGLANGVTLAWTFATAIPLYIP